MTDRPLILSLVLPAVGARLTATQREQLPGLQTADMMKAARAGRIQAAASSARWPDGYSGRRRRVADK